MHPLQPMLNTADRLARCCAARNYIGAAMWAARLLPPIASMWATDPPTTPAAKAEHDRHAMRVVVELRAAMAHLSTWTQATGRRGVVVDTAWLTLVIDHAIDVLKLPGLDDKSTHKPDPDPLVTDTDEHGDSGG